MSVSAAKAFGSVEDLHNRAMQKADEAFLLLAQARIAFARAAEIEMEACRQWDRENGAEPTRSILIDSSSALSDKSARCGRIK